MKIKQVEELVGITRKNIRFYEEQGLLNVERAENGYREYHQEDVIRLQEIKLFRKMDISIEEMKSLFEKKKSLQICLEQHLRELEHRKEDLSKMQGMCERLILEHRSLDSLNARTQTLMTQIASSWEGEASTAYINIMTERIQKAGQMKELLQEFISYMESTRTKFVSRDQESSYSIRGC